VIDEDVVVADRIDPGDRDGKASAEPHSNEAIVVIERIVVATFIVHPQRL
jgi:hypothetical protein